MNRIKIAKALMRIAQSMLTADKDIYIAENGELDERVELAGDSKASEEAMMILCEDPDYEVRLALAGNPNCPEDALDVLVDDSNRGVRDAAEENYESRD